MENRNDLHYRYIILIISLIAISGFSFFHCEDSNLVAFISFAATISSIILSVLAIFITVISNDSMSSLINKIGDIYDKITGMPQKIEESTQGIQNVSNSLNESIQRMINITSKLDQKTQDLEGTVTELHHKVTHMDESLSIFTSTQTKKEQENIDLTAEQVEKFLNKTSYAGLLILYAINCSIDQKLNELVYDDFINVIGLKPDNTIYSYYFYGYLMACSCLNLTQIKTFENDRIKGILKINPHIKEKIEEIIKQKIAKKNKQAGIYNQEILEKIKKYISDTANSQNNP